MPSLYSDLSPVDKTTFNTSQLQVFNKENRRQIQLINGPPGSGKSTLISRYLQLNKQQFDRVKKDEERYVQIFISDKNTAVDAISSKMPIDDDGILSFGSDRMGASTSKFSMEYKLGNHSLLQELMEEKREEEGLITTGILFQLHTKLVGLFKNNIWHSQSLKRNMDFKTISFVYNSLKEAINNNILASFLSMDITTEILEVIDELDSLYSNLIVKYNEVDMKYAEKKSVLTYNLEEEILSKSDILISTIGSMHYLKDVFARGKKIYVTCILDEASAILTSSLCKLSEPFRPRIKNTL